MSLHVYSQNLRGAFSYELHAHQTLSLVEQVKPDVAIFPEAYNQGQTQLIDDVRESFDKLGYEVAHDTYDDEDGRQDRRAILAAVRKNIVVPEKVPKLIRVAGRNMVQAWVMEPDSDQAVQVFGIHLDDRGEPTRQAQGAQLLEIASASGMPTVFAGDFNSVHKSSTNRLEYRAAQLISGLVAMKLLPATDPESVKPAKNLGRVGSKGKRLHEMASGRTIQMFIENGFIDADPSHQPTAPASRPFAQLDHTMVDEHFAVEQLEVLQGLASSDHLAVSAYLALKQQCRV